MSRRRTKPAADAPFGVLFLCTGNAARSILAEALLNRLGGSRFRAYSAGSRPKGEVDPRALALLERLGLPTEGLRSKSWAVFGAPDTPRFDLVVTVCDRLMAEACPVWPWGPVTLRWNLPDPTGAGDEAAVEAALIEACRLLEQRIGALCALPVERLGRRSLQRALAAIGPTE